MDEIDNSLAQKWFATGEPNLFDPKGYEDAGHAQVIRNRQLWILGTIGAGSAINAAVVTAIGNRDPKIGDVPAVLVYQASAEARYVSDSH
jgi:hypothetical protein